MPEKHERSERQLRAEEHFRKLGLVNCEENAIYTTAEEEEILISDSEDEEVKNVGDSALNRRRLADWFEDVENLAEHASTEKEE